TMGVDIGSTTSKCLMLRNGSEILSGTIIRAGTGTSGPRRAVEQALSEAGVAQAQIHAVTATGYGRNTYPNADYVVSELSCHALGAHRLFPEAQTVIDIGGQDAKVLRLGKNGKLDSFLMNDKCAAGTGRFLDVMARTVSS
ncbi:MAG: 2-hydroxyglutaryl-CoA dehydratase, partial [Clostridia bacterium]|nr:2-hydroxyglutaryl-CoA dehydratase [Clostridia bacterium]